MSKALLIKSYTEKGGSQGKWNELEDAFSYIQGINTGKVLDSLSSEELNSLISGVPSPWARAKLFKFAFDTIANPDPNIEQSGLFSFYQMLCSEWKGLVAVMALFRDRITLSDPIELDPDGGNYDIASAFGRMLFEDKDIWSNQEALAKEPDEKPFIQLIYYNGHLIGGTSPLTGFFTGVDYSKLKEETKDINWYRKGLLEDPTSYLNPTQLQKVYLFVRNMNHNLNAFETMINSQRGNKKRLDLDGFKKVSRDWETELKRKGNLGDKGPVAKYENAQCPFSILLESNVPVFLKEDKTFTYSNDGNYESIGDIQELLSTDNFVVGWTESADQRPKLSDGPMFYVRVKNISDNCCSYFTIPLSEKGVDIFKNSLSSLLGYTQSGNSSLSAQITEDGKLSVSLVVEIDGKKVELTTREYCISWQMDPGKVTMWPNFVSDNWNRYYVYSEFTSDAQQQFAPIFKWNKEIVKNINGDFLTSRYELASDEERIVDVKKLVTYPSGEGDDLPKYNIIGADKPIFGLSAIVKETGKEVHAGFLICKPTVFEDFSSMTLHSTAIVGFDFGSNNTCVYYNPDGHGAQPVPFENNRLVLVGYENTDKRKLADNDELLFFSNFSSPNGQFKSWLHEHDSRYNSYNESLEIAGGVPVNRPNVKVVKMDPYVIRTQAGILHYNMKWLDDDKGLQKKRAFIKTLWLQTCAYLYKNKIKPIQIFWSYPGSMMESDINELEKIFEDLCKNNPINGCKTQLSDNRITEAEAVCSFAQSQDFGLNKDNIFLGIDVGGSTSDILLLAKDSQNSNQASLYRESSVRMAAGCFFDAVTKSEEFRKALVNFHERRSTSIHVENIKEILKDSTKAPYYLNSIFDQLSTAEEYDKFYSSIDEYAKFVFTIPAYVTGLLLFYSGMLIGKVVKSNKMEHIKRVDILPFGKGGRLFHWLRYSAGQRTTYNYYSECVNAGIKCVAPNMALEIKYRDETEEFSKSEVAQGLCDMKPLCKLQQNEETDICGERNVSFTTPDGSSHILQIDDELDGEYFANEMNNFNFSGAENFEEFLGIFIDFVSQKTSLYKSAENTLSSEIADIPNRISAYVTNNDSEYRKARKHNENGFHYHQPIIIAEGACFLPTLINKVFNR